MARRGPVLAAVPWWSVLASVTLAVVIVALLGRDPGRLVESVRWAALALALGVAGVFDEPSAELRASLPTPDRRVRLGALAVAAPVLVASWVGLTWFGDRSPFVGPQVAAAFERCLAVAGPGLGLEAVAVLAITMAAAAFAARRNPGMGAALAGGAATLLLYAGRTFLPDALTMAVGPTDPRWQPSLARWALLLAVAAAGVLAVTGDRWRRPRRLVRAVGWLALGVAVVALVTLTARPRSLPATFDALVGDQELAAAAVSVAGPQPLERQHGGDVRGLDVLRVTVVDDGATGSVELPVAGTVSARQLRSWSSSLTIIDDGGLLAEGVAARPPEGLAVRSPEAPPDGRGVAEVIVDHRSGTTVASVAAAGGRTCGVTVAGPLHALLTD